MPAHPLSFMRAGTPCLADLKKKFYGRTHGIWKLLAQGLNPSCSYDLCSCARRDPLTMERGPGSKPAPMQQPDPLQAESQPTMPCLLDL